jgi:hypothetical protein
VCLLIFAGPTGALAQGSEAEERAARAQAAQFINHAVRIVELDAGGNEQRQGWGLIVGSESSDLYIATPWHVVWGRMPPPEDRLRVKFLGGSGAGAIPQRIGEGRMSPDHYLDLAVLVVKGAADRAPSPAPLTRLGKNDGGTWVWQIGRQANWELPGGHGFFIGLRTEPDRLRFDGLRTPSGTSGQPIVTRNGIAAIVTTDGGDLETLALSIDKILDRFREWHFPVNLLTFPSNATGVVSNAPSSPGGETQPRAPPSSKEDERELSNTQPPSKPASAGTFQGTESARPDTGPSDIIRTSAQLNNAAFDVPPVSSIFSTHARTSVTHSTSNLESLMSVDEPSVLPDDRTIVYPDGNVVFVGTITSSMKEISWVRAFEFPRKYLLRKILASVRAKAIYFVTDGSDEAVVWRWQAGSGSVTRVNAGRGPAGTAAFDEEHGIVAINGDGYRLDTGEKIGSYGGSIGRVGFRPSSNELADTEEEDGKLFVEFHRLNEAQATHRFAISPDFAKSYTVWRFSPDGSALGAVRVDRSEVHVTIWLSASGVTQYSGKFPIARPDDFPAADARHVDMDFSRDKKSVAVLVKDEIQLLNYRTKSLLGSLGGEDIAGSSIRLHTVL